MSFVIPTAYHFPITIPDASPTQDGVMTKEQAAKLAGIVSGNIFVFRPGGVAGGNVYTDWAALVAATDSIKNLRIIEFDDSLAPCIVPPGTWDMTQVFWSGIFTRPVNVNMSEGVRLPGLRMITGQLIVTFAGATPPVTDIATNNDVFFTQYGSAIQCGGSGPFIRISTPVRVTVALFNAGRIAQLNVPVIDLAVPGVVLQRAATIISQFEDNTLSGVAGTVTVGVIGSSSGFVSENQPAFLGMFQQAVLIASRLIVENNLASGPTTFQSANQIMQVDPSSGPVPITMPPAFNNRGQMAVVKNATTSANAISILPQGGDTVDGNPSDSITSSKGSRSYISDGVSNWVLVAVV